MGCALESLLCSFRLRITVASGDMGAVIEDVIKSDEKSSVAESDNSTVRELLFSDSLLSEPINGTVVVDDLNASGLDGMAIYEMLNG